MGGKQDTNTSDIMPQAQPELKKVCLNSAYLCDSSYTEVPGVAQLVVKIEGVQGKCTLEDRDTTRDNCVEIEANT